MNQPKISVIVPVYNTEKYLEECISSIVDQTFKDIEIICIDDGSTDNSLKILKDFEKRDDRITVIHQENQGPSKAKNVGLNHAKGEYVIFIDSDDFFELTAFEQCYSLANELSFDFMIFKLLNFDNESRETVYRRNFEMKWLKEKVGSDVFNYNDISQNFFKVSPTTAGKFYKRELLKDLRFNEQLIFEDNPFFVTTLLKADRIYFHDSYLYNRRLRNDSITHSNFQSFSDCVEIYEIIIKILEDYNVYDFLKEQVLRNQCKDIFNRFTQVSDDYKKDFFDKIQNSFLNLKDKLEKNKALVNCDEKTRVIFYTAIESESGKEFESKVSSYLKVKKLNKEIKSLKNKNKKLERKIKELEDFNQSLLNSNSWKLTKPLRKLKNLK